MVLGVLVVVGMALGISTAQAKPFEKVYVYKDKPSKSNFAASGFMPEGKCVAVNDAWVDDCNGNRSCIQAQFDRDCTATGSGWAGVYWLRPANNWGDVKGAGLNLKGAKKLTFWARGENGGEVVTFKMGGVGMAHPHPDSDTATTEPITLTKEWKEYTIDLTGKDLSHIIGGFAWIGTAKENQAKITFYLANIYYN